MSQLIFEKSVSGSNSFALGLSDLPADLQSDIPAAMLRDEPPPLPDVAEVEVVRHFTALSKRAYGVDDGFYPLGSCTMKYNPRIGEWAARLPGFAAVHPAQSADQVQGCLELMYRLERMLCEITGMHRFTLQPAAGAHGELVGALIIKAYHAARGDTKRNIILVPDSAHGTNPATASMVGFKVVEIKSNERGLVDLEQLQKAADDRVAGLMLTNPNTLGLFEEEIARIAEIVHNAGGLLYYDGANLNGIMGVARPGDMGFDIVHLNLHKTFAAPHGGGGPGAGPVGVKDFLSQFLPVPLVEQKEGRYYLDYDRPASIGRVLAWHGNFAVLVKAFAYLLGLGAAGVKEACQNAVLNANYLRRHIGRILPVPYDRLCKHEFVATGRELKKKYGVSTLDVAKRLLDYGYHPPTVYFPLIVEEALMIEPTETESKQRLDDFIRTMQAIVQEAAENPQLLKDAPRRNPVRRLDETAAARQPVLRWQPGEAEQ